MATVAQRDRQIFAAEKRVHGAQIKLMKAYRDVADLEAVVKVQTERIAWLRDMPVDDAPDDDEDDDEDAPL